MKEHPALVTCILQEGFGQNFPAIVDRNKPSSYEKFAARWVFGEMLGEEFPELEEKLDNLLRRIIQHSE